MGSSLHLRGAPLPEGPGSSQGKPGGRGGSLEESVQQRGRANEDCWREGSRSMERKHPILEPQGDESREEWRRPGEGGRKQEGRGGR